jgi:tRNA threonylcarbamoyladenosine biosynthesis protein TsaB
MKVLAFDCSGDILSVAVRDGEHWAEASLDLGLKHAERLMDLVDRCVSWAGLKPPELELIACTIGPGSFTGLRIGISTAKGMALGLGLPWIGIPSLDCLAWGHEGFSGPVAPIMDARRGRVYSAIYLKGLRIGDWLDVPLAELAALLDTYQEALVTGPDAELFEPFAADRSGFRIDPKARYSSARALAVLGEERFLAEGGAHADAGPLYLRPVEAEKAGPPPGAEAAG